MRDIEWKFLSAYPEVLTSKEKAVKAKPVLNALIEEALKDVEALQGLTRRIICMESDAEESAICSSDKSKACGTNSKKKSPDGITRSARFITDQSQI